MDNDCIVTAKTGENIAGEGRQIAEIADQSIAQLGPGQVLDVRERERRSGTAVALAAAGSGVEVGADTVPRVCK